MVSRSKASAPPAHSYRVGVPSAAILSERVAGPSTALLPGAGGARLGAHLGEDALQPWLGVAVDVHHRGADGGVDGGDLRVHLVRDRAVGRVALAAGAQLDELHRLARVE